MNSCLLSTLLCMLAVSLSNQQRPPATDGIYIFGGTPTDRPAPSRTPNSDRNGIPIWSTTRYPGSEEIRYPSESKEVRLLPRIPQPPIVGPINIYQCRQRKYMHLRACYYALHPEHQSRLDFYTRTYLCKEWRLKEQEALRAQQSTQNTAQQTGAGNRAFTLLGETTERRSRKKRATMNDCSSLPSGISLPHIEAEDEDGKIRELLGDINHQLFQTFYVKRCTTPVFPTPGLSCLEVQTVMYTAVYVNTGNVLTDDVEMKNVKISFDCALHRDV